MHSTSLLRRAAGLLLVALALTGVAAMAFGRAAPMSPSVMALRARLPQTTNYTDPTGPLLSGRFASAALPAPDELVVVTFNLRYAEAIEEAVAAFQTVAPLPAADFILLQEMDEAGAVALARALGYDYVYAPASVAEDGDDFGNAILSRWPLSDPRKIILPGLHPLSGQQRTATRATARVGEADMGHADVVLYSVHLEIATAPPELRREQAAAVLADVPDDAPAVIIGGDFNTIMARGVAGLAEQAAADDLQLLTAGLEPTLTRFGRPLARADHIVTRGFERLDGGVLSEVTASDHFPVWARLASKG